MLIDELIEAVEVHDDHPEVTVQGAPRLNVTLAKVGLGHQGDEQSCRRAVVANDDWRVQRWPE